MITGQKSLWQLETVLDVARNLPLKFRQNRVSNSCDIAEIEFVWVGGWWIKVIFGSHPTFELSWGWVGVVTKKELKWINITWQSLYQSAGGGLPQALAHIGVREKVQVEKVFLVHIELKILQRWQPYFKADSKWNNTVALFTWNRQKGCIFLSKELSGNNQAGVISK